MYPSYLDAYNNGTLAKSTDKAFDLLGSCSICPRKCSVNRLENEIGFCKTGLKPRVCSYMAHHGEEPPISGSKGSGTIFFSYCNMSCAYCQNYEFSQQEEGREVDFNELAGFMIELQNLGCHNINLVTPTHVMPQILKALQIAVSKGLNIPLVYNTGGYEFPEMIKLLDGIVDIYLPDMRYADPETAAKLSMATDYPKYNRSSVKEMHRQVGIAKINDKDIIERGLIIRHLVLPNNLSGTEKTMKFIAQEISKDSFISLMSQYTPYYKAREFKEINRRITVKEYKVAQEIMEECGLYNGWTQDSGGHERFAGVNIKPIIREDN
ncbi:MAG: radical SAM protein [Candidatus Omnitrophica bacterium]|nr:radical SAM protein [Candidatus Omnitrophota bacterium]MBU1869298.1 radical SAM protein [Candidatus Omnitrophota bacterium]